MVVAAHLHLSVFDGSVIVAVLFAERVKHNHFFSVNNGITIAWRRQFGVQYF